MIQEVVNEVNDYAGGLYETSLQRRLTKLEEMKAAATATRLGPNLCRVIARTVRNLWE